MNKFSEKSVALLVADRVRPSTNDFLRGRLSHDASYSVPLPRAVHPDSHGLFPAVQPASVFASGGEDIDSGPDFGRRAALEMLMGPEVSVQVVGSWLQVVGGTGMEKKADYTELVVWQRAMALVPDGYTLLKAFPQEETYALADQIRRAVVSIPANIAEGQARQHRKEFIQHLSIAKGRLAELHTLLMIAQRLRYLSGDRLREIEAALETIGRPLAGLINRLRQG